MNEIKDLENCFKKDSNNRIYEVYFRLNQLLQLKSLINTKKQENVFENLGELNEDFFNELFVYLEDPLSFSRDFPFSMCQIVRVIECENKKKNGFRDKFFKMLKENIKSKFEFEFKNISLNRNTILNLVEFLNEDFSNCEIYLLPCLPSEYDILPFYFKQYEKHLIKIIEKLEKIVEEQENDDNISISIIYLSKFLISTYPSIVDQYKTNFKRFNFTEKISKLKQQYNNRLSILFIRATELSIKEDINLIVQKKVPQTYIKDDLKYPFVGASINIFDILNIYLDEFSNGFYIEEFFLIYFKTSVIIFETYVNLTIHAIDEFFEKILQNIENYNKETKMDENLDLSYEILWLNAYINSVQISEEKYLEW
jgi:hypothetical protein